MRAGNGVEHGSGAERDVGMRSCGADVADGFTGVAMLLDVLAEGVEEGGGAYGDDLGVGLALLEARYAG